MTCMTFESSNDNTTVVTRTPQITVIVRSEINVCGSTVQFCPNTGHHCSHSIFVRSQKLRKSRIPRECVTVHSVAFTLNN